MVYHFVLLCACISLSLCCVRFAAAVGGGHRAVYDRPVAHRVWHRADMWRAGGASIPGGDELAGGCAGVRLRDDRLIGRRRNGRLRYGGSVAAVCARSGKRMCRFRTV